MSGKGPAPSSPPPSVQDRVLAEHFLHFITGCGPEGRVAADELAPIIDKARTEYGSIGLWIARMMRDDAVAQGWL